MKKEVLELSLKYSFVTPLTSMVVTKPLGENTDVLSKPKEGETPKEGKTPKDQSRRRRPTARIRNIRPNVGEHYKCEQKQTRCKFSSGHLLFFSISLLSGQCST